MSTLLGWLAGPVWAQCSQCARTAAAQGEESRQAMNAGILLMMVLVWVVLSGFVWMAWLRQDVE